MDIRVDQHTAIAFDLDDTLYNEIEFLKSAYASIARELDPDNWRALYILMFSLYRSKLDVFDIIGRKYKADKEALIQKYRHHRPDIQLFEGALEVIRQIKNKKGRIAIITDGRKVTQMNKIHALGLADLVDEIVISEAIGTEKPHEKNFKVLHEALNLDVYYYIADNLKKDFITPRSLGWQTIGIVDNGLNIHFENYKYLDGKHEPHQYFSTYKELRII